MGLVLCLQPHSSMAPGAAGSHGGQQSQGPGSRLGTELLWGDAQGRQCPSRRTTRGSSCPSCASGCRTAVGRGMRVPSSVFAAQLSRSWVSTSSSTSLWMRANCNLGAVGLPIQRSAPCTWPRRCEKLRFLGWALGTSLLWGTTGRSVEEGRRGRDIRGRCSMSGASGWRTWRRTAQPGNVGECAWRMRSFLWTASSWLVWTSPVRGKGGRAAVTAACRDTWCRLQSVLIYAPGRALGSFLRSVENK